MRLYQSPMGLRCGCLIDMENKEDNQSQVRVKSFLTSGPTLHYSHSNVLASFWFSLLVYLAICSFWAKINYGHTSLPDIPTLLSLSHWKLSYFLTKPLSIFEYPFQAVVLGGMIGLMVIVPLMVSLMLSFSYSILFLFAVAVVAQLPGLAAVLLISCFAIASRPLRFRSRFISVVLCLVPLMLYWFLTGGVRTIEPLRWAYSYFPWMFAWIVALFFAGIVLGLGHYTRYRPGSIGSLSLLFLLSNILIFANWVGFSEADYQIYVEVHNLDESTVFETRSITPLLDAAVSDPVLKNYLTASFYSRDPIMLRSELKRELVDMLRWDHWPQWFADRMPAEFDYQSARKKIEANLDMFMEKHPRSWRMPQVLYYKAMLTEMRPSLRALEKDEVLEFDSCYASTEAIPIWGQLYRDFPSSPESIEARYRIAVNLAGRNSLDTAYALAEKALDMIEEYQGLLEKGPGGAKSEIFSPIPHTVITNIEAEHLRFRLEYLLSLIDNNKTDNEQDNRALSEFISLNHDDIMYEKRLRSILASLSEESPLRDNVELAIILEHDDIYSREKELGKFIEENAGGDSLVRALFEYAKLKLQIAREIGNADDSTRIDLVKEAGNVLRRIQEEYPANIYSLNIARMLTTIKD